MIRKHATLRHGRRVSLILMLGCLFSLTLAANQSHGATATYQLTVHNSWSEATHPGAFPQDAHFSFLGGATHSGAVSFWSAGTLASPGMEKMAETGFIDLLQSEVQTAINAGTAGGILGWEHWFCPAATTHASCGATTVEFTIDSANPLVTLATMLGPSPDWFVGVSGLALHDGGNWLPEVIVDLVPYDGGTESATNFIMNGPDSVPQELISLITGTSGQDVGPGNLGTLTFTLLTPAPAALPLFLTALAGLGLVARRTRR